MQGKERRKTKKQLVGEKDAEIGMDGKLTCLLLYIM